MEVGVSDQAEPLASGLVLTTMDWGLWALHQAMNIGGRASSCIRRKFIFFLFTALRWHGALPAHGGCTLAGFACYGMVGADALPDHDHRMAL